MSARLEPMLAGAEKSRYEVVVTEQLVTRPLRKRGKSSEASALLGLAKMLSTSPELLIEKIAAIAMELTGAPSAGFSMLALRDDGTEYFKWMSMSGRYSSIVEGCSDRIHSPCGVTLELGGFQLFDNPGSAFPDFLSAEPPLLEGLVVPVMDSEGVPFGTLWMASHSHEPYFDAEDARLAGNVAAFAGAALESLRQRDEAMRQVRRTATEDQRKDDFVLALAHELRNPLGAIATGRKILASLKLGERADNTLDRMGAQIKRMDILIEDLMELGKIRLGIVDLRRERVGAAELLAAAASAVLDQARDRGVELSVLPVPHLTTIDADPARMTQVLVNLLTNAIKYTPAGGSVELSCEDFSDRIEFAVQDTGIGLDATQLSEVFSLYSQVDRSTASGSEGLGIGLSLVRRLMELHGGEARAFSEGLGRGSRFVVALPKPH